jgi:D-serine ammonia-lyase
MSYNHANQIENLMKKFPLLQEIVAYRPVLWVNEHMTAADAAFSHLGVQYPSLNPLGMNDAELRLQRLAPLIARLFPETGPNQGIIESKLEDITRMKEMLQNQYQQIFEGRLLLKCDSHLPVAGSVKARGGIYEVLKHAEDLALINGILEADEDYAILAEPYFRKFFNQYALTVGSTGNLGLGIGITGAALGFKTVVHMSHDAMAWKKDLLRSKGVEVIEYDADYTQAVEAGRMQSKQDFRSYFVDDEKSRDLFIGYSVAALRLKKQLAEMNVTVDNEHPLLVYLPCGVGGAPGGICYGLKTVFGDQVHCFFVEPTHSPCMLVGLLTGENEKISVFDLGLDNRTAADGLAVGRASGLAAGIIGELVSGIYTVEDDDLYRLLAMLADSQQIAVEPSAAPSLLGPVILAGSDAGREYIRQHNLEKYMRNAVHIAWATGGSLVPEDLMQTFYQRGEELLRRG